MTARADLFKCAYCNNLALLRWPTPAAPTAAKLEAEKKWTANLLRPGSSVNWQGGELLLTRHELVFVPQGLNIGPIEKAVLPFGAIASTQITEGFISDDVQILDMQGQKWGVRVRKGKEILAAIEHAKQRA